MHRCTITKLTLPLFVTLFVVSLFSVKGQGLQSKLDQRVEIFDSESSLTASQLIDLAQRFQIPMGIELVDKSEETVAPPIHARNTTVQRIIQQIVHERPGTGFTLSGGVVHVFASSIINDPRNFLSLRVPHFRVENESLFGAEWLLRVSIHEVLNPGLGGYGGGHGYGVPRTDTFDVRNLSFSVNNATVRQILNGIVAKHGNALWLVRINPSQMMANGRFYAQAVSATNTAAASDFHWKFLPLKEVRSNNHGPVARTSWYHDLGVNHVAAVDQIRPRSYITSPLDLQVLTREADLIVIGRVDAIDDKGPTVKDVAGQRVEAERMVATLSINRLIKGQTNQPVLSFEFLIPSTHLDYHEIKVSQFGMYFVRKTAQGGYDVLNSDYPFIIVPAKATVADGNDLDKVVGVIGLFLTEPKSSVYERREAVHILNSARTELATRILRQATQDSDTTVRLQALCALLKSNDISMLRCR